eukprot:TRINITY_DN24218_c0_g1_i1.p1 TRINITY_DN24218_c0_g1~~TRINITY_DN24218_c0_g1_i1.p1  ORF type:complete len:233 (-),score=41.00 TRINITY_DN24218_c0_g1_i1:446-1057(-)
MACVSVIAAARQRAEDEAAAARAEKMQEKVNDLFGRFDDKQDGCLNENEVKTMIVNVFPDTPEPSACEMQFIMKMADTSPPLGLLGKNEFLSALHMWRTYQNSFQDDDAWGSQMFGKYDKDDNGTLTKPELKLFLTDLNSGQDVTEEDVEWVLAKADVLGSGGISKIELSQALAAWFHRQAELRVAERRRTRQTEKSRSCVLL